MTEKIELVRGSGNVFRDFNYPNADVEQLKSILAAKIIGILDDRGLSVRKAEDQTGVKASEFSRIRNAHLERFTVDRLMSIINRLHCRVEVKVSVKLISPTASRTAHLASP
jgi:predicted XRE-type DNA-binding protein